MILELLRLVVVVVGGIALYVQQAYLGRDCCKRFMCQLAVQAGCAVALRDLSTWNVTNTPADWHSVQLRKVASTSL
jgi:hypothetical protein